MELSRREFMALLAAAGSTACVGNSEAKKRTLELLGDWPDGRETWTPTICRECPSACGLLGRVVDGRVVGLVGNPLHPVNRGSICARGIGALQTVYDSDRFREPLVRSGRKLVAASWDEALARVGERLSLLRGRNQPQRLTIAIGGIPGLREEMWVRFARVFGTPNLVRIRSDDRGRATVAERIVYGVEHPVVFDWGRSDFVISFSSPLLDGGAASMRQHRQRLALRRRGGRLVQVESRLSATAANADDWLAIAPGSEAALALTLSKILLDTGRYDPKIEELPGFGPWVDTTGETRPGFREWVRGRYGIAWCEAVTGIEQNRIEALADELSEAESPVVIFDRGRFGNVSGLHPQMAFAALNLLIGAPDRVGGFHPLASSPFEESEGAASLTSTAPVPDSIAKTGLSTPRLDGVNDGSALLGRSDPIRWVERIARHDGNAADVILIDGVDPIQELPNGTLLSEEFERTPLVVALATRPDATTAHADVVLPARHFLETWSDEITLDHPRTTLYSVAQPVIEPLSDARPAEEIIFAIGDAVGHPTSGIFPESVEKVVRSRISAIHGLGRGRLGQDPVERQVRKVVRDRAEVSRIPRSGRRFFKKMMEVGLWIDSAWTPSEKISPSFGGPHLDREIQGLVGLPEKLRDHLREPEACCIPHYEGPLEEGDGSNERSASGLSLIFFETAGSGDRGSRAPWLQETRGPTSPVSWSIWIELNPRTAMTNGIRHGQRVRIVTSRGEMTAVASLTEAARPGYIYVPLGVGAESGHAGDGRFLIEPVFDPVGSTGLNGTTRALIVPVRA